MIDRPRIILLSTHFSFATISVVGRLDGRVKRKCITKVLEQSQRVKDLEMVIWLRRSVIRLGGTIEGTRQNVGMVKLRTGLLQIFSSVDFVPICANKSFKLLEITKLVIDLINWFREVYFSYFKCIQVEVELLISRVQVQVPGGRTSQISHLFQFTKLSLLE